MEGHLHLLDWAVPARAGRHDLPPNDVRVSEGHSVRHVRLDYSRVCAKLRGAGSRQSLEWLRPGNGHLPHQRIPLARHP